LSSDARLADLAPLFYYIFSTISVALFALISFFPVAVNAEEAQSVELKLVLVGIFGFFQPLPKILIGFSQIWEQREQTFPLHRIHLVKSFLAVSKNSILWPHRDRPSHLKDRR
jgi:hypothetical protein